MPANCNCLLVFIYANAYQCQNMNYNGISLSNVYGQAGYECWKLYNSGNNFNTGAANFTLNFNTGP